MNQFQRIQSAGKTFLVNRQSLIRNQTGNPFHSSSSQNATSENSNQEPVAEAIQEANTQLDISCHADYFKYVIGRNGMMIRELTSKTGAKIIIPRNQRGMSTIQLVGARHQVQLAQTEIQSIVTREKRRKQPYTHFLALCFPLPSELPSKAADVAKLQQDMRQMVSNVSQPSLKVIPWTEMHITLAMLRLPTLELLNEAKERLNCISTKLQELLNYKPLLVNLQGIGCFGNPATTRTLHANVEDVNCKLTSLTEFVLESFSESGLIPPDEVEFPKFHTTLLRFPNAYSRDRKGQESDLFNCGPLLEKYKHCEVLSQIRLPSLGLFKREFIQGPEGSEYRLESNVLLP